MGIASSMNTHVWVIGQTVDPTIVLANDSINNVSVNISVFDINGNLLTSTTGTIPPNGVTTVNLGDALSALTPAPNEGFYIVQVSDGVTVHHHPLIISTGGSYDLPTPGVDIPSTARIHTVVVQHKWSGLMLFLPPDPNTQIPNSDSFLVMVYVYDPATRKGQIWYRDGFSTVWNKTKEATKAIIEYTYQFPTIQEMAEWLIIYNRGSRLDELQALAKLYAQGRYVDIANIANLWFAEPAIIGLGRLLDYKVDTNNLTITVRALVYLGFGWNEVKTALKYAAAGALITGGLAAAAVLAGATGGAGTVAGAAVAGAAIGLAFSIIKSDSQLSQTINKGILPGTQAYIGAVSEIGAQGIQNIENQAIQAENTVDQVVADGIITQQEAQLLKQRISELKQVAISAINDTINECREQIDSCISDYKIRLLLGAGGAGAVGYLLGRK